jgi:hypothetical protein
MLLIRNCLHNQTENVCEQRGTRFCKLIQVIIVCAKLLDESRKIEKQRQILIYDRAENKNNQVNMVHKCKCNIGTRFMFVCSIFKIPVLRFGACTTFVTSAPTCIYKHTIGCLILLYQDAYNVSFFSLIFLFRFSSFFSSSSN